MPFLHFHGQGKKVAMSPEMLKSFTEVLPCAKKYADLALAIAQLGTPSLTTILLEKDKLGPESLKLLWNEGDSEFQSKFSKLLKAAQNRLKERETTILASPDDQLSASGKREGEYNAKEALAAIVLHKFPKEEDFKRFRENYLPLRFQKNPSLGIGAIESLFYLLARNYVSLRQGQELTYALQTRFGLREKVSLVLGEREFDLNLELLTLIANYCLNEEEECRQMVCALFETGEPLIMSCVVWTDLWPLDAGDNAWKMGDYPLCYELVDRSLNFVLHINDDQARDIINLNDENMLCCMAANLRWLLDEEDYPVERRISAAMLDKLVSFIAASPYPAVIKCLGYNDTGIPEKYQEILNSGNINETGGKKP